MLPAQEAPCGPILTLWEGCVWSLGPGLSCDRDPHAARLAGIVQEVKGQALSVGRSCVGRFSMASA